MHNSLKKTTSILLVFIMTICSVLFINICVSAEVYSGECGDNLSWSINDITGELIITGTGSMTNWETKEAVSWDSYRSEIKSVSLPEGLTNIGNYAFQNCAALTNVTMPSSLEAIGYKTFESCRLLKNISIPSGTTSIESFAFNKCAALESVTIPSGVVTLEFSVFCDCVSLKSVIFEKNAQIKKIDESAFDGCCALVSIELPSSLSTIGKYAFIDCYSLESVQIPNGVSAIDNLAFSNCISLNDISIPESVTSIGFSAFTNTKYYKDLSNWEDGVLYIDNALIDVKAVELPTEYRIKDSTTVIAHSAFPQKGSLKKLIIPSSVTHIGKCAFQSCKTLETVLFESSSKLTFIAEYAFEGSGLKSVRIPASVAEIGSSAFGRCAELATVTFEDGCGLKVFAQATFYECYALKNIEIPKSFTNIAGGAFHDCTSLKNVYYEGSETDRESISFNTNPEVLSATWHYNSKMPAMVASIAVKNNLTKTVYKMGEKIDLSGLTLTAIYTDGTTETITDTSKMTVTAYSSMRPGNQAAIIEYEGCQTTINVSVEFNPWQWIIYIFTFAWLWG